MALPQSQTVDGGPRWPLPDTLMQRGGRSGWRNGERYNRTEVTPPNTARGDAPASTYMYIVSVLSGSPQRLISWPSQIKITVLNHLEVMGVSLM